MAKYLRTPSSTRTVESSSSSSSRSRSGSNNYTCQHTQTHTEAATHSRCVRLWCICVRIKRQTVSEHSPVRCCFHVHSFARRLTCVVINPQRGQPHACTHTRKATHTHGYVCVSLPAHCRTHTHTNTRHWHVHSTNKHQHIYT